LSISEAFQELRGGDDALAVNKAESVAQQEVRTLDEVERLLNPPPPPPPEPEPEPEPPHSLRQAYESLREGESTLDVERAEQDAIPGEVETPELVERLMQPPPEPEPEPEPEPVNVRSALDQFLAEDRQRYSLEEALKRAAELAAQEIDPNSPTTTPVESGWDTIDNAQKPFLRKDGAA
jgi:hypothetical protein